LRKTERIAQVTAKIDGITANKAAQIAIEEVVSIIQTSLRKEGRVSIAGLGTFFVTSRAARKGRNPATCEGIKIKASRNVRLRAAPDAKEAANKFKVKPAAK
jgi:DNA-binding protein HU-beta